jgi:hypothetical protein
MFVTNFKREQLVQYYLAIQRHMQYRPPYELWIEDKPGSSGLRQDGPIQNPNDYSLHVNSFLNPGGRCELSLFWTAFRELGEEASGTIRRK